MGARTSQTRNRPNHLLSLWSYPELKRFATIGGTPTVDDCGQNKLHMGYPIPEVESCSCSHFICLAFFGYPLFSDKPNVNRKKKIHNRPANATPLFLTDPKTKDVGSQPGDMKTISTLIEAGKSGVLTGFGCCFHDEQSIFMNVGDGIQEMMREKRRYLRLFMSENVWNNGHLHSIPWFAWFDHAYPLVI